MKPVKVLVVDDSSVVCEMPNQVLLTDPEIQVVGWAKDGQEAVQNSEILLPDVICMYIRMPRMDALQAISYIMSQRPVPILVVTEVEEGQGALSAISDGALEVVRKSEIEPDRPEAFQKKASCCQR